MFEIKPVQGHFEVYQDGHFYCSADTETEAEMEIRESEVNSNVNTYT